MGTAPTAKANLTEADTTEAAPVESRPCVICLSPLSEESRALPCRHAFDYLCLVTWLGQRPSCPLCNAAVSCVEVLATKHTHKIENLLPRPAPAPTAAAIAASTDPNRPFHPLRMRSRASVRPASPTPMDLVIARRRHVYRHELRCLHVGSNRISRFRSFGPADVRNDEELVSRAKAFVRRELQVFEYIQDREFLVEYVVAILKSVDLKSTTGAAEDMMTDFLGRRHAGVFCHELREWLRSPYRELALWDRETQYAERLPTGVDANGQPMWGTKRRAEEGEDEREARRRRV